MTPVQYKVYVTPLATLYTYGTEVEITDRVENVSGSITKSIDSQDFSVGVYTFNDVQLTCENSDGKFCAPSDSRSMFGFSRDRAKVRIVYDDGTASPKTTFRGLINDEATTVQSDTDELQFTLLGPDSVFKSATVPAGQISNGMTVLQALTAILSSVEISAVLSFSLANINPKNNITIDDGTRYDNVNKRDAIAELLGLSNSVMIIDASLNIIVRNRLPNYTNAVIYLYGKGDPYGRENIVSVPSYNTGLQRTFNSVLVTGGQPTANVNDVSAVQQTVTKKALVGSGPNLTSQILYGVRQKAFSFASITSQATLNSVAASYAGEFAYPKIELEVVVPTSVVSSAVLLDQVSVSYPLFVTPSGRFLPVIGVTVLGDVNSPLPYVKGSIQIDASLGFKIIEMTEDITTFQTTLKLRQVGVSATDGVLVVPISTRTITSDSQILSSDDVIFVDCTLGAVRATLPQPTTQPLKGYIVIKIDTTANLATVAPYGSEKTNGQTSVSYASQYDGGEWVTDQVNWYGFALNRQPISKKAFTSFTLVNNQSSAANVTGLSFDGLVYRTAIITIDVRRKTDTASSEVRASHLIVANYNAQAGLWTISDKATGDSDGVTFSVSNSGTTGQIQYTSTNITGANGIHNSYFNAETFNV